MGIGLKSTHQRGNEIQALGFAASIGRKNRMSDIEKPPVHIHTESEDDIDKSVCPWCGHGFPLNDYLSLIVDEDGKIIIDCDNCKKPYRTEYDFDGGVIEREFYATRSIGHRTKQDDEYLKLMGKTDETI
jgi:Zn-finger protein